MIREILAWKKHPQRFKDPHEEADTPVCIHAKLAIIEDYKALIIEATCVAGIAVSVMAALQELGLERRWIGSGQGRTVRWISFHELVSQIGP